MGGHFIIFFSTLEKKIFQFLLSFFSYQQLQGKQRRPEIRLVISFMTEVPIIYPYRFGLQINDWSLSDGDLCHERIKYCIFVLWFCNYYVWDEGSCNFITKRNKWWLFVWHIECGKEKRRPIINKALAKCQLDKHQGKSKLMKGGTSKK